MKPKVLITVHLDDSNNVGITASTKNLITIVGMMVIGIFILFNKKEIKQEEPSNLLLPKNGDRLL